MTFLTAIYVYGTIDCSGGDGGDAWGGGSGGIESGGGGVGSGRIYIRYQSDFIPGGDIKPPIGSDCGIAKKVK